ncbi:MAG: thiol:disulfide interchange protein DsbA/DsbL [Burkholderiales bacterium]
MFSRLLLGLLAIAFSASLHAQGRPLAGRDYVELQTQQPTETGAKIEVIEFFWYRCPHCHALEPTLTPWVGKLANDTQFRLVPAIFNDEWALDARVFYALEATGNLDRLHHALLDAIHKQGGANLKGPTYMKWVSDWLAKQSVDISKYDAALRSFTVESKVKRAFQIAQSYRLEGVPALAVQGKYVISGEGRTMFAVADFLIAESRRVGAKKPPAK